MSTLNTYNLKSPDSANTNLALDASGNVAIQAGSASTPSVYVTGDANTGLYSPGADQIAVATGGTARLYINSSGQVGVGSTTPAGQLSCTSDFVFGNQASTGSGGTGRILATGGEVYIQAGLAASSGSAAPIVFTNYGGVGERARLDASGRLLVGTSSAFTQGGDAQYGRFQMVGNTFSSAGAAILALGRGEGASSITTDEALGFITFSDNAGNTFAGIYSYADANAGSNDYPGRLVFSTTADGASSPTERMRIRENGQVLINRTSSATGSVLEVDAGSNVAQFHHTGSGDTIGIYMRHGRGLSGFSGKMITFRRNDDTEVGSVVIGVSSTAYNTSSDYRLKENIVAVDDGIARLQQLKPSRFNFIDDPDRIVDGFIAHEVQAVVPEAITGEKDAVDEDGNPKYQGIDQSKLVPLLTAALQEAIGRIETLEAEVAALKAQ